MNFEPSKESKIVGNAEDINEILDEGNARLNVFSSFILTNCGCE